MATGFGMVAAATAVAAAAAAAVEEEEEATYALLYWKSGDDGLGGSGHISRAPSSMWGD